MAESSRRSAVISLPVPDFQDANFAGFVVHLVDDPVISNPEPVSIPTLELEAVLGMRVFGQAPNGVRYAAVDRGRKPGYGLSGLPLNYGLVAHRDA